VNLSDAFTFQEKQTGSEADGLEMKALRSRRRSVSPTTNHVRADGGASDEEERRASPTRRKRDAPDSGGAGAAAIARTSIGEGAAGDSERDEGLLSLP